MCQAVQNHMTIVLAIWTLELNSTTHSVNLHYVSTTAISWTTFSM